MASKATDRGARTVDTTTTVSGQESSNFTLSLPPPVSPAAAAELTAGPLTQAAQAPDFKSGAVVDIEGQFNRRDSFQIFRVPGTGGDSLWTCIVQNLGQSNADELLKQLKSQDLGGDFVKGLDLDSPVAPTTIAIARESSKTQKNSYEVDRKTGKHHVITHGQTIADQRSYLKTFGLEMARLRELLLLASSAFGTEAAEHPLKSFLTSQGLNIQIMLRCQEGALYIGRGTAGELRVSRMSERATKDAYAVASDPG